MNNKTQLLTQSQAQTRAVQGSTMRQNFFLTGLLCCSLVMADGLQLNDKVIDWVGAKYGMQARQRTVNWHNLMSSRIDSELSKLERVNDFFNRIPYRDDYEQWDTKDYWATPIEALASNAADCEDYAIAKYFTLRELGVSPEKLRITYVKAVELDQAHMVLAYYQAPEAIPLILDNLNPSIRSADERDDLVPVYSFNAEGLWLAVNRGHGKRLGDSQRLSLWNEVRDKMEKELKQ